MFFYLRKKWYGIKKIKIVDAVIEGPFWDRKVIKPAEYKIINPNDLYDTDILNTGKAVSSITYALFVLIIMMHIL